MNAPRPRRRSRKNERGVALILVVISLAVLTVVATEFAYNSRVDLQLAANHRDEIRAYYLARSGIGLSRLLLKFQAQLDNTPIPNLSGLLAGLTGGKPPPGGAATPSPQTLSIQLWRMAKVDCHMLEGMIADEASIDPRDRGTTKTSKKFEFDALNPELAAKQANRSFGGFEGCFDVTITDEEERLNVSRLDAAGALAGAALLQATELFGEKRFEFLYEKEDSNKVKATAQEVILAMRDWADEDETGSAVNPAALVNPLAVPEAFAKGFGDENRNYDRFQPRYKAKNARYDSLDELYMVHGVNDHFMAAFKDRLTVYTNPNKGLNINTDDPLLLYLAIRSVANPLRPDPRLQDPIFIDLVIQQIRLKRVFSLFGMSVLDFVNIVESMGVAINPSVKNATASQNLISDKSNTYRLRSVGTAGAVEKQITAVVRTDTGLGKLLYWRED